MNMVNHVSTLLSFVYNKKWNNLEIQIKSFPSWVSFTAWKEEEERRTYSFFVQPKGAVESVTEDIGK